MIASIVASLAFAGWKKRLSFIGAALAAAVLANWLRAYLVILAATLSDRRVGVGPEHVALGWIFYSALILGLIALARRLADAPQQAATPAPPSKPQSGAHASLIALASCALIAAYDFSVVSAPGNIDAPNTLPALQSEGFTMIADNGEWSAHAPQANARSTVRYRSAKGDVTVSASYVADDRAGAEIASTETRAADGVIWRRLAIAAPDVSLRGDAVPVRVETLENDLGQRLDVAALYWLGDRYYTSPMQLKARVAINKLAGKRQAGGAFFIATDASSPGLIHDFLASAEPAAVWRARIDTRTGVGP
jgi:EpsI family protein